MIENEQRRRAAAQAAWETARLTIDPQSVAYTTRDTTLLTGAYRQLGPERLWSSQTEVIVEHRLCAADVLDETTRHAVAIVAVRSALNPNCPPDAAEWLTRNGPEIFTWGNAIVTHLPETALRNLLERSGHDRRLANEVALASNGFVSTQTNGRIAAWLAERTNDKMPGSPDLLRIIAERHDLRSDERIHCAQRILDSSTNGAAILHTLRRMRLNTAEATAVLPHLCRTGGWPTGRPLAALLEPLPTADQRHLLSDVLQRQVWWRHMRVGIQAEFIDLDAHDQWLAGQLHSCDPAAGNDLLDRASQLASGPPELLTRRASAPAVLGQLTAPLRIEV